MASGSPRRRCSLLSENYSYHFPLNLLGFLVYRNISQMSPGLNHSPLNKIIDVSLSLSLPLNSVYPRSDPIVSYIVCEEKAVYPGIEQHLLPFLPYFSYQMWQNQPCQNLMASHRSFINLTIWKSELQTSIGFLHSTLAGATAQCLEQLEIGAVA